METGGALSVANVSHFLLKFIGRLVLQIWGEFRGPECNTGQVKRETGGGGEKAALKGILG